jgi:hypothetical protein
MIALENVFLLFSYSSLNIFTVKRELVNGFAMILLTYDKKRIKDKWFLLRVKTKLTFMLMFNLRIYA